MKLLSIISLILLCSISFASDYKHSITGSSTAAFVVNNSEFGDSQKAFAVAGSYSYLIVPMIQFESLFSTTVYSSGSTSSISAIMAGPVFNIFCTEKNKLQNAFFIAPKIGFSHWEPEYGESQTVVLGMLEVGKRFALSERVSWNVSVVADRYFDDNYDEEIDFQIKLFSLSIYL